MFYIILRQVNSLNAKLNRIRHLVALLGAHHILHISRIRVNSTDLPQILYRYKNSMLFSFFAHLS